MKISYRTHPILKYLESGSINDIGVPEPDMDNYNLVREDIEAAWVSCHEKFSKNIQCLTHPFEEAITLSLTRTLSENLVDSLLSEENFGTILRRDYEICYWISPDANGGNQQVYFHFKRFKDKGDALVLAAFIYLKEDQPNNALGGTYYSKTISNIESDEQLIRWNNILLYSTINFIKYAEIQTKELPAGQKVKGIDCKYINDTKSNIKILDSTWFTNLVKSDAFKVRGHFRLQPKKINGEWTKELIWVSDYEKHGYTAPARKLKVGNSLNLEHHD